MTGESAVVARVWTSAETSENMGSVMEPVIIWAELSSGHQVVMMMMMMMIMMIIDNNNDNDDYNDDNNQPVSGAELEARVRGPDGSEVTVRLGDSGTG